MGFRPPVRPTENPFRIPYMPVPDHETVSGRSFNNHLDVSPYASPLVLSPLYADHSAIRNDPYNVKDPLLELLERYCFTRDDKDFELFSEMARPWIRKRIKRYTNDEDDIYDIEQEVLIRIANAKWSAPVGLSATAQTNILKGWLGAITKNESIRHLYGFRRLGIKIKTPASINQSQSYEALEEDGLLDMELANANGNRKTDPSIERVEYELCIEQVLSGIKSSTKRAVAKLTADGIDNTVDISRRTGIPVTSVKRYVNENASRLEKCL